MKYTAATLALLAGLAAAQTNPFGDAVPDCAAQCVVDGITAIGCTVEDPACACTTENLAKLASNAALIACITSSCTDAADIGKAAQAQSVLCAGVGGGDSSAPASTDDATASASASESAEVSATASESAAPTGGASNSTASGTGGSGTRPTPSKSSGGSEETGSGSGDSDNGNGTSGAVVNAAFGGAAFLAALLAL